MPFTGESRDDVGKQLVLAPAYFVAQAELALLHPRELKLVGNGRVAERDDRGVKIAMLEPKQFQALGNFLGVHPSALPRSRPVCNGLSLGGTDWPNRDDMRCDS